MLRRFVRIALLVGVILGIVGPKSSALMAELGLIDASFVVICTGDGVERISLDGDGNPVEHSDDTTAPCPLVHAVDGAAWRAVRTGAPLAVRACPLPAPVAGPRPCHTSLCSFCPRSAACLISFKIQI